MVTRFRVVTLNLEQDHKRWDERSPLVVEGMKALQPDIIALNEVSIARQTARELQRELRRNIGSVQGIDYNLVQQTRVNGLASVEGEALLTRFAVVETGNLDFQTRDMVAQVARILVDGKPLDVYVTHLYMSRGDDSLRLFQVQQLLEWVDQRKDVSDCIVCGDFNATLDMPSAALMSSRFRPTQTSPTAFTPLAGRDGAVSHPYWPRMDRCIDYIWTTAAIETVASGVCFDKPDSTDPSLWPSDHAGVWADLEF
jgi:endonuclease/exonuclease/phosphatase family metal-dependent hydrolase